jgi:hypothetical protein
LADLERTRDDVGDDGFGLAQNGIAEGDINAECLAVQLAGQSALGAESQAFVFHSIVLDFGLFRVATHFEAHEIAEYLPSSFLKICKYGIRRPGQPQIDILSGPSAFQPKFKYEPAFQEHRVPQHGDDARQESVEHQ